MSVERFEVGKRYRTLGGDIVRVIAIYPNDAWAFLTCVIEADAPELEYKTTLCPNGRFWNLDDPHPLDVVEEIGRA